jgi:hypothetical protein
MSSLGPLEKRCLEDLFGMGGGYVMDFSNRTFRSFFLETARIDIYSTKYAIKGDSKAKRLLAFFEIDNDNLVGKVIAELLEYWRYTHPQPTVDEHRWFERGQQVVERLIGRQAQKDSGEEFLDQNFGTIIFDKIPTVGPLNSILELRMAEAFRCLEANSPLAVIFLCGSIVEGLLLGVASANPQQFNQAPNSPKDKEGKVKQIPDWSLANLIDVSCEVGYLKLDIRKFGHALRDFRNYIHPYQQLSSGFNPDKHTAAICLQVLKATVASLSGGRN